MADGLGSVDVFGLKLEVSNPRLAELLAMNAKEALTTDVRHLVGPERLRESRRDVAEAAPGVVVAPHTPHDEEDARKRHEFRSRVEALGSSIGFETAPDGVWRSPTGVILLTRAIEHPLSFAAASHFVSEIAERRGSISGDDSTVLFVVDDQQTSDVFKVAIRQGHLFDLMRTVSIDNLEEIRILHDLGVVSHTQAVILLVPVADIDVGEIISIVKSASSEAEVSTE